MFLTAALTIAGAVLLGLVARKEEKNPFMVLGGLSLVGISLFMHVTASGPLLQSLGFAAAELGAGSLVIAGMLAGRKDEARSFFVIGAGAVVVGVAIILIRNLLGPSVSILVELGPDDTYDEIAAVIEAYDGKAERAFPGISLEDNEDLAQVYLIDIPEKWLDIIREILRKDTENVDHVELNSEFSLDLPEVTDFETVPAVDVLEDDPLVSSQWALDAIRAHQAHALLESAEPVRKATVAIIDTGVDARHEDMSSVFEDSPGSSDKHGHGTHCAGIAGAATNNGLGVASLNWEGRFLSIISFSALDDFGRGTLESTAQAILDATRAGADVLSMSLGSQSAITPKTLRDAVKYARDRGAIVIAAAGNSNIDARGNVPSNIDGVIAVGAVTEHLEKAPFSNLNNRLNRPIAAPGVNILSLKPTGGYVKLSGTSMATPMVSGLAGVLRSLDPDLTDSDIYDILLETGKTTRASSKVGVIIDAEKAIGTVLDG